VTNKASITTLEAVDNQGVFANLDMKTSDARKAASPARVCPEADL